MEKQDLKDSKKITRYEFKIVKVNDLKNYEYLVIELSINKALQELILNKFVVTTKPTLKIPNPIVEYTYYSNTNKRYLGNRVINRELSDAGDILTDINLLSNGKLNLKFESLGSYNRFVSDFKFSFKTLLEKIRDLDNINLNVYTEI